MRYAIVSDLHANLQAWEATLADIQKAGVHQILCLGDVIGYGPNPMQVYEQIRSVADATILGNHDAVVCDRLDPIAFNPNARRIIEWTAKQLDDEAIRWFGERPMIIESANFDCSHAEFEIPGRFRYIFSAQDAVPSFKHSAKPLLFVGHTHRPGVVSLDQTGSPRSLPPSSFDCLEDCRYLINVGSVGDPRNGDTCGSYVILDIEDGRVEFRQVPFDVNAYRDAIAKSGLDTRPMLFNFVQGGTIPGNTAADEEEEFKPSDKITVVEKKPGEDLEQSSSPSEGRSDIESIAKGAALLLLPLLAVGAFLLATRPERPERRGPEPQAAAGIQGEDVPATGKAPVPPPTGIQDTAATPEAATTAVSAPPAGDPAATAPPIPAPGNATTATVSWPEENPALPGRIFRLPAPVPADSLAAIAQAVVAAAPDLADKRVQTYLDQHPEPADADEYKKLAIQVGAVSRWQQRLAGAFNPVIGLDGAIQTLYGERRVRILAVAENGLSISETKADGTSTDDFLPFDDLTIDECQRRLATQDPALTSLMHGIISLRGGRTQDATKAFTAGGGLLGSGLLELTAANNDALLSRAAHRASAILYNTLKTPITVAPEDVATLLKGRTFSVPALANLRLLVNEFERQFGNVPAGRRCQPIILAVRNLRPQHSMSLRPDPAHAFPLSAPVKADAAGQLKALDLANPTGGAPAAADTTTVSTLAGDLIALTRQSDCLSAALASSMKGNPAFTIAFWARSPESDATRTALSIGSDGGTDKRFAVQFGTTWKLAAAGQAWDTGIPTRDEIWQYHIITRGEGGTVNWWLYSDKVATGRISGTLELSGDILLGANLGGLNGSRRIDVFRGNLKDVHVYPRILLDTEIRSIATEAKAFADAAGLNSRSTAAPAAAVPAMPPLPFSPRELGEGNSALPADFTWQGKAVSALESLGRTGINAPVPVESRSFTAMAAVPADQPGLRGIVFRIRAVPGDIVADSALVAPGKSVIFHLPVKNQTGQLRIESTPYGDGDGRAVWINPGFSTEP